MVQTTFKTGEVADLVGVSLRELQWWDTVGLVNPSRGRWTGTGHARIYTPVQIQRVRIVKRLRDCRVSLPQIKLALVGLVLHGESRFAVYSRGKPLQVYSTQEEVFAAFKKAVGGSILVGL